MKEEQPSTADLALQPEVTTVEEEERQIRENINKDIQLGNMLSKLKKNPDFKYLFGVVFLARGSDILWDNIRHLSEMQLIGKGSERNEIMIKKLEKQVKSRLDFSGFMDTVENDAEMAVMNLEELDAAAEEENSNE